MAPKVARGRKKANVEEKKITDMLLKDNNSNGLNEIKNNCSDTNTQGGNEPNLVNDTKKLANNKNDQLETNGISEKYSNNITEVAPLKQSKKNASDPAEVINNLSEKQELPVTKSESSESSTPNDVIPKAADDNEADPNSKEENITDDQNKPKSKVPLKRGRAGKIIAQTSEETSNEKVQAQEVQSKRGRKKASPIQSDNSSDLQENKEDDERKIPKKTSDEKILPNEKNASIATKDDITDEDTKVVDGTNDKKELENNKVLSRRGQPRKAKTIEKIPEIEEEKALPKRGQRKVKTSDTDNLSEKGKEVEELKKKTSDEKLQVKEKVPSKRGQKKEAVNDEESSNVIKEQNDNNVADEEIKIPPKRGRRKANQKETDKDSCDKESNENNKELIQGITEKEKPKRNKKAVEDNKNEKQESEELVSVGNKRKNEASEETEKDMNEFKETKVLKVALERRSTIEKMFINMNKVTEKGGAKNKKAGDKRANEKDTDSKESGEKSPKISKSEPKSKGQSKKDNMPDVKLLDFSNNSTSQSGKPWNLKISSWNVNGVRAWLEKDGLAYINHENPDIMAFQETKCSDKMLPDEVNVKGYQSYWLAGDKDGYSGVGLLSKNEPISVQYGIGVEEHDNEGRVITAEYDTFYLVTAYIPNAGRKLVRLDYRMKWDKDFCSYLKKLDEKKSVVLCGDLNVAHEEIDLANPKTNKKNAGFTKEEREGFSALLSEGFVDSFRHLYPDEKDAYTFWTYMMNSRAKNVGWRLDYFVLSKKFVDNLCDSVIRKDVFGSDHCPITLFLSV